MYLTPPTANTFDLLRVGTLGAIVTPDSHRPEFFDVAEASYWAADNGCFTAGERFDLERYLDWLDGFTLEAKTACMFATAPDVVGDFAATWERSEPVLEEIRRRGFPAALVIQDGAENFGPLPWDRFDAIFTGGSTEWKLSEPVGRIVAEANERGKWTHCGRVNSTKRMMRATELGHYSADGTLLLFGPEKNLPRALALVRAVGEAFGPVGLEDGETHNPYAAQAGNMISAPAA